MAKCWIDMETTGLDAYEDVPLEVCLVLTRDDLEPIAKLNLLLHDETIRFTEGLRRLDRNDFVKKMHQESGLWDDLFNGDLHTFTIAEADERMSDFVTAYLGDDAIKAPLAGQSIGSLDRPFSIVHFPTFNKTISHRNLDNRSIQMFYQDRATAEQVEALEQFESSLVEKLGMKQHRAEADTFYSIETYKWLRDHMEITI